MKLVIPLILLWLSHFIVDFMLGVWTVYKTIAGFDLAIAGIIAAFCALLGEGSQLLFGALSDKGYRKRLIALGVTLASANAFLGFTNSPLLAVPLLLLTCIGSGAFHPAASALLGSLTLKQKGLFFSFFSTGGALGMALSQIVYANVHAYFDGNALILLVPITALTLAFLYYGYMRKEGVDNQSFTKKRLTLEVFADFFSRKAERNLFLLQVFNQMLFWGTVFFLPDILVRRGYDFEIAYGGGNLAFVIGAAVMMVPMGLLADKFSPLKVIMGASFIGMIFFFAFILNPTLSPSLLLIFLALSGSMLGIIQPIAIAVGNELGKANPGVAGAFSMGLVWCVSETVGPMGLGFLSKLFVEDAPAKALLCYGLFFPLTLLAAYNLKTALETDPVKEV